MAKIPRYKQQQLASEVVGTPGVDTSTAKLFQTVSGGASAITNALFTEEIRKQRFLEAEERALARQRENMLINLEVSRSLSEYSIAADEEFARLKREHATDPSKINPNMQKFSADLMKATAAQLTSEKARLQFQSSAANLNRGKTSSWVNQISNLEIAKGKADIDATLEALAVQAGNAETFDTFNATLVEIDDKADSTALIYGANTPAKLLAVKDVAVKNYVRSLQGQKRFDEARAIINDKQYATIIDSSERLTLSKNIQQEIDAAERAELTRIQLATAGDKNTLTIEHIQKSHEGIPYETQLIDAKEQLSEELAHNQPREKIVSELESQIKELEKNIKTEGKEAGSFPNIPHRERTAGREQLVNRFLDMQRRQNDKTQTNDPSLAEMGSFLHELKAAQEKGIFGPTGNENSYNEYFKKVTKLRQLLQAEAENKGPLARFGDMWNSIFTDIGREQAEYKQYAEQIEGATVSQFEDQFHINVFDYKEKSGIPQEQSLTRPQRDAILRYTRDTYNPEFK